MRAFQDMLLGPLKAVLMRALQQQLSKYIHNIELEGLGLMGGDVVLENLEIRKDVLHESLRIPTDYDISRGFIRELRIHIPWTRLQSRPIEIKFKTVEIIVTPIAHTTSHQPSSPWLHSRQSRSGEEQTSSAGATTGWLQQLLTKVLANMSVSVSNLVLKYEDADVVLSAALKSLVCFSANPGRDWTPAFASLDDPFGLLHKLVRASDLTVCLDRYCAPDPTGRRQVQAFEVPILNRASFDVRLLACVWLVAPGPPESSFAAAWEYQQAQVDWQDGAENDGAGIPPSPGRSGSRRGLPRGTGESPKPPTTPKTPRSAVTVLDRLVGGDRRAGGGIEEVVVEGLTSGATVGSAEVETDELPLPCVCPLLRDGWSRRVSSSYSPFFDGEGVWSPSEAAGASIRGGEGVDASAGGARVEDDEERGGVRGGGGGDEGKKMPTPSVVADVLIADLCFSLSNLQVQMMKELIDRAVHHVARNASRNTSARPLGQEDPRLIPKVAEPAARRWWPFGREAALDDAGGDPSDDIDKAAYAKAAHGTPNRGSPAPFEPRDRDAMFVVASTSVRSVELRLLTHHAREGEDFGENKDEEEAAADDEPESISVPVHGLGTVSVLSAPVSARRQALRPPVAFVVAEVKGLALDAHVLAGGDDLSADVKVEVSSIVVRHAGLGDAASPKTSHHSTPTASGNILDQPEPVVTWGEAAVPAAPTASAEAANGAGAENTAPGLAGDRRPVADVQRLLVERARRLPRGGTGGEVGLTEASPTSEGTPRGRGGSASAQALPSPSPTWWADVPSCSATKAMPEECALQYRLLKRKSSTILREGAGGSDSVSVGDAVSTVTSHTVAAGALRVQVAEVLLEKLLKFADVRRQAEKMESVSDPAGNLDGEEKQNYGAGAQEIASAAGALAQGQGLLWRANRLSPRASNAGSAVSSPRVLPFVQSFSSASTWETSFSFALSSVATALDLDKAGGCGGVGSRGEAHSPGGFHQVACCVLSLGDLDISGSESASVVRGGNQQQQRGWHAPTSPEQRESEVSQRVCSLSLGHLSVTFVDASALVAGERAPPASPWPVPSVFIAATLPGTQRLMQLSGARVTAEILSELLGQAGAGGVDGLARPIGSFRGVPDFLFNASVESLYVGASIGAALVVLEVCLLARKMTGGIAGARVGYDHGYDVDRRNTSNGRWERCWRRVVGVSFDGVSLGGTVKGGGGQVKGNLRRLSVHRGGGGAPVATGSPRDVPDVALFEAMPGEGGREGLSWTLETFNDGEGSTDIELTSVFKSGTLHYANTKKAVREVMRVLDEWKAGSTRIGVGMTARDAGNGTGPSSSPAVDRRSPSVKFNASGSVVRLHLPFELDLEVRGVHLGTRPAHQTLPAPNSGSADTGLDINLLAGDVQVFHALYGVRCSPEDALPPAIRCAARGIVTIRPAANATAVSLESEYVRARLTPAFCTAFGSFIRFMVGPPLRPTSGDSTGLAAASRISHVPKVFTFKLRVRGVDVDFIGDPCSPSAVSANIHVGGVAMKQKSVGETLPGAGSKASFGMSFETVEATQRRDPWRNAPAIPREAALLIRAFLGKVPLSESDGGMSGGDLFSAWLSARKAPGGERGAVGPSYTQPFIVRLSEEGRGADGAKVSAEAFSVLSTSSGPRRRLVNSLSLRLTPILLACYPPTFRLLVGHYNRFGGNAFRPFRSRADMPPRRIAVVSYDIDIRGCSAVLLASLADGARGIHLSAGVVSIKENTAAAAAAVTPHAGLEPTQSSSLATDEPIDAETTLALSGFVGPAGMSYLQDWHALLPAAAAGAGGSTGQVEGATKTTQLCVPIDLRWAVFYDRLDRCRQDISLSSVQLYLEQSHFDLCVRVAQAFIAADYPGALPPRRRRSTLTATNVAIDNATAAAGGQHNLVSSLSAHQPQTAASYKPEAPAANESAVSNIAEVKSFLAMSLRLPLLQCVLAVGKRNGPFPPVLEIDVASVRLARGGILTVRHVSVNSWSQEVDMPMRPGAGVAMAAERGRSGCGYRVLGRSGQSEESGKDFLSMEVRVPDVQLVGPTTPGPTQPQLDVVIQVQPFDVHVNPSVICSLTSYVTPIPFTEGSSEAAEVPFPHFLPPVVTPFPSNCAPSASAARDENPAPDSGGLDRGSSAGERVSTDFEKSAMTASASVRLLASQVSLELSSYPGGPALIAGASHVFVRAITWPPDASRRTVSSDEGAHGRTGNGGRAQVGPEMFARVTRVTCGVKRGIDSDGDAALREDDRSGGPCRADQHGDTILKPFDIDVHLTRPRADPGAAAGIASKLSAARGWHAGVYVDELYLRFGAVHTRSLELLGNLFLPAMAAASLTATKLARGQREHGTVTGKQWQHRGHIGDLRALERVECAESIEETTVTPEPGEAVFYGVEAPQEGLREDKDTATRTSARERGEVDGGWVHCCEWRYWGPRRVAQIALPYAPLSGSVPLLEGLAVDSLEVELSFVDPLTQTLEAATRFNVPCQESSGSPNLGFAGRKRVTVEPSQPFFAREWRLSWRIPAWLRSPATAAAAASPEPIAISTWSSLLLQALSVYSSPAGPTAGPSYVSTTLVAQRVTLAVLTDGDARSSSSSLLSVSSRPSPSGGGERGAFVQLEEIVRMVISDVSVFAEASSAAGSLAATTRGSAEVAVDVQDFSNFLRLPLLSHALVKWDFAMSGSRGGAVGGDEDLLSPLRPVAATAVEVHNAVVSVSVTSMQCVEQCIAELSQQSAGAVAAGEGSTTREMFVGTVESTKPSASACSPPPQRQPRQRSKRYVITNLTDRVLWFGQGSTTETLLLGAGEETSYRWRTTPAAVATASASRKDGISRLVLMLRLALHLDPGRHDDQIGADSESRADSGPWTEPFPADDAGSYMRLLRSTGAGWQAGAKAPLTGVEGSDPMVLPLWVEVIKEGLQTRIVFHGEWVFTNHLPQEVQVAWVTSAGVGDAGRRLVEPVGMRGGLNLAACGPDKASDDSDAGQEAEVPRPGSCSALTACNAPTGSEPQRQERFSELMLEFRLVTPDASTVVGSVGPPPRPTGSPVAHPTAPLNGRRSGDAERSGGRRVGEGFGDDVSGLEEDATSSAPWLVTRQSEWVEARPCVYLSLISCASPDPQSSGFWFWCVASRRASPLSDCAACVSRAAGHSCHLGQMNIDLRPVAVIWNRCSQPMRIALNFSGGRGEWRERNGPAFTQEVEQEQARAQDGRVATRERHSNSAYGLSDLSMNVQPGGRTVACKQPFVDYDLAVTPATVESGRGSDSEARPFLVSVPSELLSRRSESRWIPLHSRALVDNVLCPLVVIASRLVNADWPSLSLRIYPGLSMHNHLRVPLSLRTVFTRQTLDVDRLTGTNEFPVDGGAEYARTLQDEQVPLVHREASGGNAVPAGGGGGGGGGDGDGGSSTVTQDAPDSCLVRVVQAPAESCHSTWGIFHGEGYPIPYVLPALSLELGIASEEATASLPVTSGGVGTAAVGQGGLGEGATGTASPESVERRSRKLKVRLDDHFRELVLIPWGEDGDVVLPVFVTLEREQILGGVELIKLAVYPRVVVHNATGLPITLSLFGAAKRGDDGNERTDGHGETRGDAVPVCRVCLSPEGSESSMNVLALPGKRSVFAGPGSNYHDSSRAEGVVDAGRRGEPVESPARSGLFGKLSWLLGSSSYTVSPQPAGGFFADLEVAFGWDDAGQIPASGVPADGKGASVTTAVDEAATNAPGLGWHPPGVGESTIFSVGESSGGVPLRSEPSSLTVVAEGGQRAVRVCISAETPDADRVPPTRHILLYRDPQPDITVCNRSGGPITLLFDCGTLVEVYPGCTAEHSWQEAGNERGGKRERSSSTSSATARSSRLPSTTHPDHRARGTSEMSDLLTPMSSAPGSPAASGRGGSESAGNRPGFAPSPGNIPAAAAARKPRPSGKLGGDATLRHCFQCKGGRKHDAFVSWSDPLWVARGVQVIRFDNHGEEEEWDDPGGASGGGGGGGIGDGGDDGQGGFGIGSAREVQVHVVERAGGFLMSFAEGGFDGEAADGVGLEGSGGDAAAERRGVLRRWATTREHHVVVSVSSTTLQLLDDSNLQAVAPVGHEASQTKVRTRETAARATSEGLGAMDGWVGGAWGEPGGFLSNGASTHLPAAALPAIISVFVDATSARLWKTAPAVRPGMSALDLERSWHLKDRVGIDVRLGTVQVDNHVAGHSLPVLFCFRNGGSLVSSNGTSGSGGDVTGDCRFTMTLVLAQPWKGSRVPSYLEKVRVRSAPIDVCLEDSLLPPLLQFLERAGLGIGAVDGSFPTDQSLHPSPRLSSWRPQLPPALSASMMARLFIQRVDIGVLVVRATVQGYIPGKQVFLALDKSPLLFRPVSLRGVLARPDQIAEQIASNYAVDALLRSLAVVGSLEALGSPTTLLSAWGKGVYDLFAMPIRALPQGPTSTVRATFRGLSSLLRHASAGTLSSVSGVTNALSRNLRSRGRVVRPIAGTMNLMHRTSRLLIASTGVDSEWAHAKAATEANPAVAHLNADLWYRWCLLPEGHEFIYQTPALCSNASYSQANVPVTIVLSSKAVFLYRGGSGCEELWKQIEHQDITLIEQSAEHAPAELILNARAYRRPRSASSSSAAATRTTTQANSATPAVAATAANAAAVTSDTVVPGRSAAALEAEEVAVGGLLIKLSLPSSAWCRELAQLLHGLSGKA